MDVPITNTVVSPSSPRKFGTYIFLATYHLANTTGIETLTIRIAQNGSFRKENQENQENQENLRKYLQNIMDFIFKKGRFVSWSAAVWNLH